MEKLESQLGNIRQYFLVWNGLTAEEQ